MKVYVATGCMDGEVVVLGVGRDLVALDEYARAKRDEHGRPYTDIEVVYGVEFLDPPAQVIVAKNIGTLNM